MLSILETLSALLFNRANINHSNTILNPFHSHLNFKKVNTLFLAASGAILLSACSFVEDRSASGVRIVDAQDARKPITRSKSVIKKRKTTANYTVVKGDTFGTIAKKMLGSPKYYKEIAEHNGLSTQSMLSVGQVISIPHISKLSKSPSNRQVRALKRPRVAQSNQPPLSSLSEMDKLIANQNHNQAIDYAISQGDLATNLPLQSRLVEATEKQVQHYKSNNNPDEAEFLVNGLLNKNILAPQNNQRLQQLITKKASSNPVAIDMETAKIYFSQKRYDKCYDTLLGVYNKDKKQAEKNRDFRQIRLSLTEKMHQKALLKYRNQQLDPALAIWQKILKIKPNDDLALVYRDRVINIKKKLNKI